MPLPLSKLCTLVKVLASPLIVYRLELLRYAVRATTRDESGTTVYASGPGCSRSTVSDVRINDGKFWAIPSRRSRESVPQPCIRFLRCRYYHQQRSRSYG